MSNRKISLFQKVKKGTIIKRKPKMLPSLIKNNTSPKVAEPPEPPEPPVQDVGVTNTDSGVIKSYTSSGIIIKKRIREVKVKKTQDSEKKATQTQDEPESESEPEPEPEAETDDISESDYNKIMKSIDPNMECDREELIDKLETYKFNQDKKISKYQRENKPIEKLKQKYKNICSVLADVKETDAKLKVATDKKARRKISDEFKKRFKKLSKKVFIKKIDLTAPKKERKPEVGVQIWKKSKETVFKDSSYKTKKASQRAAILGKIRKKQRMTPEMLNQINRQQDSNLNKYNITQNHSRLLGYQRYNPFSYQGLVYY